MSYMKDLDIQRRNEDEPRTILDPIRVDELADATLTNDEWIAVEKKAIDQANAVAEITHDSISHRRFISSLLLTAMQEKGIDCSSCLTDAPQENA